MTSTVDIPQNNVAALAQLCSQVKCLHVEPGVLTVAAGCTAKDTLPFFEGCDSRTFQPTGMSDAALAGIGNAVGARDTAHTKQDVDATGAIVRSTWVCELTRADDSVAYHPTEDEVALASWVAETCDMEQCKTLRCGTLVGDVHEQFRAKGDGFTQGVAADGTPDDKQALVTAQIDILSATGEFTYTSQQEVVRATVECPAGALGTYEWNGTECALVSCTQTGVANGQLKAVDGTCQLTCNAGYEAKKGACVPKLDRDMACTCWKDGIFGWNPVSSGMTTTSAWTHENSGRSGAWPGKWFVLGSDANNWQGQDEAETNGCKKCNCSQNACYTVD